MAQIVVEQKQTKILRFQNEKTEEEIIYALGCRCGGLQEWFQKVAQNLHFMKPHTIVTTMGVPYAIAFEVEAIKTKFKI